MDLVIITEQDVMRREYWIGEISRLSGNFGVDAERVERDISGGRKGRISCSA